MLKRIFIVLAAVILLACPAMAYDVTVDGRIGFLWSGEAHSQAFYGPAPNLTYVMLEIEKALVSYRYQVTYVPSYRDNDVESEEVLEFQKVMKYPIPLFSGKVILSGNGHDFNVEMVFWYGRSSPTYISQVKRQGDLIMGYIVAAINGIDY